MPPIVASLRRISPGLPPSRNAPAVMTSESHSLIDPRVVGGEECGSTWGMLASRRMSRPNRTFPHRSGSVLV